MGSKKRLKGRELYLVGEVLAKFIGDPPPMPRMNLSAFVADHEAVAAALRKASAADAALVESYEGMLVAVEDAVHKEGENLGRYAR